MKIQIFRSEFMKKNLCFHCDPYRNNSNHISEKLESFFLSPIIFLFRPIEWLLQRFPKFYFILNKIILIHLFKIFLVLKILQEAEVQDSDESIYNRSLVVVREAKKRGINIKSLKFFGKSTNHFSKI